MKKMGIALTVAALVLTCAGIFLTQRQQAQPELIGLHPTDSGPGVASGVMPDNTQPVQQPELPPASDGIASPSLAAAPPAADPAARAAFIANQRKELREHLRDLPYWMRISEQEMEAFINLRAEQIADSEFVFGDSVEKETLAEHEKEIRDFLGEERYAGWKQWTATGIQRLWLEHMNGQLPAGSGLRGEGMRAASLAMSDAEQRFRQEWQSSWEGMNAIAAKQRNPAVTPESKARFADYIQRRNRGVLEAAAPHLSSKQFQVLTEFLIADSRAVDTAARKSPDMEGGGN